MQILPKDALSEVINIGPQILRAYLYNAHVRGSRIAISTVTPGAGSASKPPDLSMERSVAWSVLYTFGTVVRITRRRLVPHMPTLRGVRLG